MPKVYVLVGVPAAGKSTWVENQEWAAECAYISTDQIVEAYAASVGKMYIEVFDDYMPTAVELMVEEVIAARDAGRDIIWDQTSTTVASRKKKLVMLPDYHKIAVVFPTPATEELNMRLTSRMDKVIPQTVVDKMIKDYVTPTEEEGFDEVWYT